MSKRCPGHSRDTLGTLFGHCGARGSKGPKDTLKGTTGTLWARRSGPKDSLAGGGLAIKVRVTRQKVGVADQKSELQTGRPPEKEPEWGLGASAETPPENLLEST